MCHLLPQIPAVGDFEISCDLVVGFNFVYLFNLIGSSNFLQMIQNEY